MELTQAPDWGVRLQQIHALGRHRNLREVSGSGRRATVDGREVLVMCSNNYLGLAQHPAVVAAARKAVEVHGVGSGGSRLISGNTPLHRQLERDLAAFKGTQDAVVFGSGYLANLGTVQALVGKGDAIASDQLNHASLIDACRLSGATTSVYPHGDARSAERIVAAAGTGPGRRALILTDGVFSMDGDLAPISELVETADRNSAILMVDDAHGTGVLGEDGRGTAQHLGVSGVEVQMGTLSKAIGCEGGFVAGSAELCDLIRNVARPFIFSTAPPPATMAAASAALRVIDSEPQLRRRLAANAARLRDGLRATGFAVPDGVTPIVPVVVGSERNAVAMMEALLLEGVYVAGIRPPTVAPGSCRLRATVMATHTSSDVDAAIDAFAQAARRCGVLA